MCNGDATVMFRQKGLIPGTGQSRSALVRQMTALLIRKALSFLTCPYCERAEVELIPDCAEERPVFRCVGCSFMMDTRTLVRAAKKRKLLH